jgi:hypothetical protein
VKLLSSGEFLERAAQHHVVRDERFGDSMYLRFEDVEGPTRYWEYPQSPDDIPDFVEAVLSVADADEVVWVYPKGGHGGYWSFASEADYGARYRALTAVPVAMGVPADFVGAVGFEPADSDVLLALLCLQVALGPSMIHDIYVVPESGRALIELQHHDVAIIEFRDSDGLDAGVAKMRDAGYALPSAPPDSTFKPQPWMNSRESGDGV